MNLQSKVKRYYRHAYKTRAYPSVQAALKSGKKICGYHGYLNDFNYGDVLVYESLRSLLGQEVVLIPITALMPLDWLVAIRVSPSLFHGLVIGGGTIMGMAGPIKSLQRIAVSSGRSMFHGTGATTGIHDRELWNCILRGKVYGGVRGHLTKQHFENNLAHCPAVVGDAAFGLFDEALVQSKVASANQASINNLHARTRILINLGTHRHYEGQAEAREVMDQFVAYCVRKQLVVDFLPMHAVDVRLGVELKCMYPEINILDIPTNFGDVSTLLVKYDFCFGERLHFGVLAALFNVPFVSIKYQVKHTELLEVAGISEMGIEPKEITLEGVIHRLATRDAVDWTGPNRSLSRLASIQISAARAFLAA